MATWGQLSIVVLEIFSSLSSLPISVSAALPCMVIYSCFDRPLGGFAPGLVAVTLKTITFGKDALMDWRVRSHLLFAASAGLRLIGVRHRNPRIMGTIFGMTVRELEDTSLESLGQRRIPHPAIAPSHQKKYKEKL
jgi:hypothetical protein